MAGLTAGAAAREPTTADEPAPARDGAGGGGRPAGQGPSPNELGQRLRAAREAHGISLRALAKRIDVSPSFISQVELGRASPSVGTLYALVTALGLSLDDVMTDEDRTPREPAPAPTHPDPAAPAQATAPATPNTPPGTTADTPGNAAADAAANAAADTAPGTAPGTAGDTAQGSRLGTARDTTARDTTANTAPGNGLGTAGNAARNTALGTAAGLVRGLAADTAQGTALDSDTAAGGTANTAPGPAAARLAHSHAPAMFAALATPSAEPGQARRRADGPVQRAAGRRTIKMSGVTWERLTHDDDPLVDFLYVTYNPGSASCPDDDMMRHGGREYGHVVSGRIDVQVGFEVYRLEPGDSIHFDSATPHRLSNPFAEPCVAVWVVIGRRGEPDPHPLETP